ncbi:MAG: T9SS type A sorting domain-containing protein [Saprospiraceae bacterium]|nr:T9SS type A sorting domain-containing protein [Saprospiraceae bacterium]
MNTNFKQIIKSSFRVLLLVSLVTSVYSQDCGQADFLYTIQGNIVKLTGKSSLSDTAKYFWTFGNGKYEDGREVKAEYQKSGEYEICVKVKSGNCSLVKCKTIKINAFSGDSCGLSLIYEHRTEGLTGIFQAKSNVDGTKFLWFVAGSNKQYEGREVKIPFEKAGIYEVCVTAFTTANCKVQVCKRIEIGATCNLGADFTFDADSTGIVKVFGKSALGDTAKYAWTFGNGKSADGKEAKIQYEKSGEYQICLKVYKLSTVSSIQPCIQSVCKTVKVIVNAAPCNLKVETESKTEGLTGIFQAKSNVDNTKFLWFVAGSNKQYEGREVKIAFEKAGIYEVCVKAHSGNCEVKVCKRVEIGATCNLGADFTFDADSTGIVKVFGKSALGDTAKYAWTFGNGKSADGKEAKIQYEKSGEYQICLKVYKLSTVSSIQPCIQSVCKTVKVIVNAAPCNLKVETESKTEGLTGIFQAKSNVDGTKFLWFVAGSNKQYEGREVKIAFEKAGIYEVCVTAYDANCKVQVCKRVEIVASGNTCDLGADFTYESDNNIIKAKATSKAGSNVKFYWTFNTGISVEGKEVIFKFDKPGEYQLCLKVHRTTASGNADSTNCTQTVCKKIIIKNQAECKLSPDFTYKSEGNTVTFSGKSSDEKAKYYWYAKDLKMELTGKDVRFQFEKAASYEICMIVVNGAETCKDQICKKITVGNRINVFPNPSADILNITVDENISKLTIYDQFNRVVHSGNLYDTYGNIDITHLNSGLYTVTVQLENGELMAKKFYKQ